MDRFRLMETYVAVARCGSFAGAADQLGVSRASVTKHIAELEKRLGVRLLNRTTRRLNITDLGDEYFEYCAKTLREIEETEAALANLQNSPRGGLKIAAPKAFASIHLGEVVAEFTQRHPGILISAMVSDSPMDQVNLVENGYDLVIRLAQPENSSSIARKVCSVRWLACAAPAFLEQHSPLVHPNDLTSVGCLVHTRLAGDGVWHFMASPHPKRQSPGISVRVSPVMRSNSVQILRSAAIAGLGVALLPTYCIANELRSGALTPLFRDFAGPEEGLFLLLPNSEFMPKKVRLFVDHLVRRFRSQPWEVEL